MSKKDKLLGKPLIMGTSGEIEKTGLYSMLKSTTKPVFPVYNRKTIEEVFGMMFSKMDNPNKLSGRIILNNSRGYLKSLTKFVKIWQTENHMKKNGEAP